MPVLVGCLIRLPHKKISIVIIPVPGLGHRISVKSDMVLFEVFCTDILLKYGRSHSHDGISELEAMINVIKPEIIAFQKPEREIKQWKTR